MSAVDAVVLATAAIILHTIHACMHIRVHAGHRCARGCMYAQFGQGYSAVILAGSAETSLASCARADARMYERG